MSPRRGFGPTLLAIATFAVALGAWIYAQRWIPEDPRRVHWPPPVMLDPIGGGQPFFAQGDPEKAEILLTGDSRAWQAFVGPELERAGLRRTSVLGRGGGQILELLSLVRRYPARKLVVAITPRSLYEVTHDPKRQVPTGLTRAGIERVVDAWVRGFARRMVPSIDPAVWHKGWVLPPDPSTSNGIYRAMLTEDTRATRVQNLVRTTQALRQMKDDGWDVFAVRLPISAALHDIEEERFDGSLFATAFASIDVPYRDLSQLPLPTFDGSHLTWRAAVDFSRQLGAILARRPGWSVERD